MARDLRVFYLFRLLATSYLWVPIFVPFMISRGLTFRDIMVLGGVYSAIVIVVEVPTGAFADRIGRRTSMMCGALIMVVSCLIAYQAHSFTEFLVSESLAAISMSLCSGADSAYLFDLLAENGVAHEYGRRESTASAWHQAGSAIADTVTARRPRTRYTIGRDAALFTRLARIMSDRGLDRALASNERRVLRRGQAD